MKRLDYLEPKNVFAFFEEICSIPHGSGNTAALGNYCVEFAKKRKLFCFQDDSGNVIIKKPASPGYETASPVILQGHLDMVLEQLPGNTLDMHHQGLVLGVDGDWLHANGTTLGGDDGIAVAYMLALLDGSYAHPPLECVFTVDEEIGLLGAEALQVSELQGRYLINLDSEEEGIFTVGCAGGLTGECRLPIKRTSQKGRIFTLTLDGLKGGHSGAEIHKERGNALKLLGRLLARLDQTLSFGLISMEGGRVENAIPSQAVISLLLDEEDENLLLDEVALYQEILRHELKASDGQVRLAVKKEETGEAQVLEPGSKALVIYLLQMLPNGVQKRSVELQGLVQTSCNLGIARISKEELTLTYSIRSSVETEKMACSDQVQLCVEFLGGTYEAHGIYPGWEYEKNSHLQEIMIEEYRRLYGKEPQVIAIHAGLECGIFSSRIPGLQCVSIGPDMQDIHSGKERLSISSTGRVWEFLLAVLKKLKD
ncbi:MAG: aminoacyl-histidine dipeptidase [Lachnospiraceae bacterium]|nr:aminoacyl-histidine dipeptidase [Lachnospiraceae bacterium]